MRNLPYFRAACPGPAGNAAGERPQHQAAPKSALRPADIIEEPLFAEAWILEEPEPEDGPWHMAADEWMLRAAAEQTIPVVRFYRWRQPQVTFGYFLDAATAEREAPGWPCTRRWTGGGLVRHGADVTFSLILPRPTPAARATGRQLYHAIHRCIAQAWPWNHDTPAELLSEPLALHPEQPGQVTEVCFRAPVSSDVMWRGGKIAGGALRRTRWGVLYQGSIAEVELTSSPEGRHAVETALRKHLAGRLRPRRWNSAEREGIAQLARERYATAAWTTARRPPA